VTSEIKNPDGSVVFRQEDIEVPAGWSQVACDILAQKYFRKAGVPRAVRAVEETGVPSWLWRSLPDKAVLAELPEASAPVPSAPPRRSSAGSPALDLLGLEGRLLQRRGGCPRLL
jgi:hypothetical protein